LFDEALLAHVAAFAPQALVVQGGADALADDPLSNLALSNNALWRAVEKLRALGLPMLVTGGGGYNPWSVARAWTGMWAVLAGFEVPASLPPAAERLLRALHWHRRKDQPRPEAWFSTLRDAPAEGPIRPEIETLAATANRHAASIRNGRAA
jgi:acetoin utilization protein AcuC